MVNHKYSTRTLYLIIGFIFIGFAIASLDSSDIDDVCDIEGSIMQRINGVWNCSILNQTDTNVSTICTGDEVLLGNGTCTSSSGLGGGGGEEGSSDVNGTDVWLKNLDVRPTNDTLIENILTTQISTSSGYISINTSIVPEIYPFQPYYPTNDYINITYKNGSNDNLYKTYKIESIQQLFPGFGSERIWLDNDYYNMSELKSGDILKIIRTNNGVTNTYNLSAINIETNNLIINNEFNLRSTFSKYGKTFIYNETSLDIRELKGGTILYDNFLFLQNVENRSSLYYNLDRLILDPTDSNDYAFSKISFNEKRFSSIDDDAYLNVSEFYFNKNTFITGNFTRLGEIYGYYLDWNLNPQKTIQSANSSISLYISNKSFSVDGIDYALYIADEAESYFVGNISASAFVEHASDKTYIDKTEKESKQDILDINYKIKDGKKFLDFETMPTDIKTKTYEIEKYDCVIYYENKTKKLKSGNIEIIKIPIDEKCKTRKIEHDAWNIGQMQLKFVETIKALEEENLLIKDELCKKDKTYIWCK